MPLSSGEFSFLHPSVVQRRQLLYTGIASLSFLAFLFTVFHSAVFSEAYMPHAFCYLQKPALVWTHVFSDTLIGLSYTAISISLGYLVVKGHRDIPFSWMFLAFGLFIIACGGTHFVETVTVWVPVYVFSAGVKVFTAIASICTAIALPFMVPQALALIREAKVSEQRRQELEDILEQRNRAQAALRESNNRLENEVQLRTAELTQANEILHVELSERKRMESTLTRLAAIVQTCEDAIIGKNPAGTITSWNRGAEKIYGYTAEEAIGRHINLLAPPERHAEVEEILEKISRGESVDHLQTTRLHKSGKLLDVSLTVSAIFDSAGNLTGSSVVARDITPMVMAEKALRDSESQYRLLFESSPLPMWVFDRDTLRFLAVNEAAVRHYGYTRQEFLNMTILDIRPAEDIPGIVKHLSESASGLQSMQVWRHLKKDKTIIQVEITGHDLNFHGADAELILAHDITERLRSEEQRRQSQEIFAKAFRASPVGITISTESEGRYVDANPSFLRVMGYEADQLVGRTVDELDIWADPEGRSIMVTMLAATNTPRNLEVRLRTRSGEVRVMELSAERIHIDDQPCVLAITNDVTDQRQLQRQFLQAQRMEAVGRMAGGVAHDFNNMLGVIIGFSEMIREHLPPGQPAERHLKQVRKAADRAAALVRQLLVFSRQQPQIPRILDLNSVIHNFNRMVAPMIGEDIALSFHPTEPLGSVRLDLGQIEQVLMNLVVNARDAMPKGGQIVLATANVDLDNVYVAHHKNVKPGAYVMLSIADTGIGMDEATMAKVFEPFFTTKDVGKGTGLGLSTVWGIVEQSDGYIWIYSELGRGTTFKIYFPRLDQRPETLEPDPLPDMLASGSETVLVVEDDEGLRTMAVRILESRGYTVLSAADGAAAIALAREHGAKIALLLTDVVMPGMTGPFLANELKQSLPELKILYMSGYAGNLVREQELLSPESQLLDKPFSTATLLTKVRAVLGS